MHYTITISTRAQCPPTPCILLWAAPPSPKGIAGALQASRSGETTAPPAAWALAFQPCAQSLTFSAAGCRCVLCYRNSPASGPLQALPLLHSETPPPPRLQGNQARSQGSAQFSILLPHTPGRAEPREASPPALLPVPALLLHVCPYTGWRREVWRNKAWRRHKEKGVAP